MRDIFGPSTMEYCEAHSTRQDDILSALERETHLGTVTPQMIAGEYQGKLLEIITSMKAPSRAIELGTFTGYSSICIARGLPDDGKLDTIEVNPERETLIRKYIGLAQLEKKVRVHIGDAKEIVPSLGDTYELAFIDAGKKDNAEYYEMLLPKIESGGILILDNVLWGGKVISDPLDKDAVLIQELNMRISRDPRVSCVMLPIRDGITIIQKL